LDAGADAVYAGLPRFNARERGENCTPDQLSRLIAYAHKNGRKVYVTLNTLVKEGDLDEVAGMLAGLAAIRPDAVIVQDIGVVRMIREAFPVLCIHASTQMGIHNSAGARMAERMGIRRVILERQTTFEEIARIREETSIELEAFVHGALCCSRSGVCLFSSWMGGWSGNRGKCKQPCRRRYFGEEGNGFFFSTHDLYSLDALRRLGELGVCCVKIEGRLRRADYVRRVVGAYRLMLDVSDEEYRARLKEAKGELGNALGRKWTGPFKSAGDFTTVIQYRSLGASGLLVGKVREPARGGFMLEVRRTVSVNDTIRVQPESGDEGPAITVTRLAVDGKRTGSAGRGRTCWIGCDKPVWAGALVFKTGIVTEDMSRRIDRLPCARPALDLVVTVEDGRILVDPGPDHARWSSPAETSAARNMPLGAQKVTDEFRRTRAARLAAGRVEARVEGNIFMPASELKRLRRAFWSWADGNIDARDVEHGWYAAGEQFLRDAAGGRDAGGSGIEQTVKVGKGSGEDFAGASIAVAIEGFTGAEDEVVLPEFCPERDLPGLRNRIEEAVEKGARKFRVTSLYGLDLLAGHDGMDVTVSFSVPVCNSLAAAEMLSHGARKVTAWVELEKASLLTLIESCGDVIEVFTYGRLPLMSTRYDVPVSGEITDGRGAGFRVVEEGGLTYVLPDKVFAVEPPSGVSTFMDLTHAEPGEPETSCFNYARDLV